MAIRHKFFKPEAEDIPVIEWNDLTSIQQLDDIVLAEVPAVIFKHSTRCDMSSTMLRKFEAKFDFKENELIPYYLDLIHYRDISNEIASRFGIEHQSPQIIMIKNGKASGHAAHRDIYFFDFKEKL